MRVRLDAREITAVVRVLKSGNLREGSVTAQFEKRFALATGARFAVAVNSGTAALFLAFRTLIRPGDEVIVPDFTFASTASMVIAAGARPVLADVDPKTFTLDPRDVERHITRRTRAIVPVHLYGCPADVDALSSIARKHRLRIVWDAAQAHGARFRGKDVGCLPDIACYSFYPSKNMTTGEGGMLATNNSQWARELRLLRSHGEESRYRHVRVGYNFRLTDIASAIGIHQLEKLAVSVRKRRMNARRLSLGLQGVPGIEIPQIPAGAEHAFCLYTIVLNQNDWNITRDEFQRSMTRLGIDTAVHYPLSLHRQPIFKGYGSDRDLPVSARLAKSVISLPVHPDLSNDDIDRIVASVRNLARKYVR